MITEGVWGSKDFGVATVLGNWSEHYKSWKNIKFAPIIVVKYEDLINDAKNTLISILDFLSNFIDIKIDKNKIMKVINSCSFETLQKKEKIEGFSESVPLLKKDNNKKINFFYLGRENNWKNLLDPQIEEKVREIFHNEMKELNYI